MKFYHNSASIRSAKDSFRYLMKKSRPLKKGERLYAGGIYWLKSGRLENQSFFNPQLKVEDVFRVIVQ
jgi:hypothetical protein